MRRIGPAHLQWNPGARHTTDLSDAQRRPPDDLPPLHRLVQRLGLRHRADVGDEGPNFAARGEVEGLDDFQAGDVAAAASLPAVSMR